MQTPRQIRRAAAKMEQRRLRKQNRPAAAQPEPAILTNSAAPEIAEVSPARQVANQRNAQLSTGPQTPEGKRRSSLNAVRTGLTGKTILLATDDADVYVEHCRRFRRDWNPASGREQELVQDLADTQWRLNRIPSLEAGFYAAGRIAFADQISAEHRNEDPATVAALLECHIFTAFASKLRNLQLQESRLRRYYQVTLKELKQLQAERKAEDAELTLPCPATPAPKTATAHHGFVFSDEPTTVTVSAATPESTPPPAASTEAEPDAAR